MWINVVITILIAVLLAKFGYIDFILDAISSPKAAEEIITINTNLGKVQGKISNVKTDDGQVETMYTYRNIPYAEPPVGDLRWRPPVPVKPWDDVFKYSNHAVMCKQFQLVPEIKEIGQEDCLILTVRQPARATPSTPMPVLFWIHGGGLFLGSSDWFYPDEQTTASLEMVTVSINYRLNIFGFLSMEEIWSVEKDKKNYHGNFGVLDVIQALKWVKENIHSFGGNPDRVTIIGESAGGAIVYSLVSSPLAAGLFTKAIPASGFKIPGGITYEKADLLHSRIFKENTNCQKALESEVVACLRNLSASTVLQNQPSIRQPLDVIWKRFQFPFDEEYKATRCLPTMTTLCQSLWEGCQNQPLLD